MNAAVPDGGGVLKDDPIIEAIFEIGFGSAEVPEVIVGRLSDLPLWREGKKARLPAADFPEVIRAREPRLRYNPTLEISGLPSVSRVRVGGRVLALHFLAPYPGWASVKAVLFSALDGLYSAVTDVTCERLNLRYINALTPERHYVNSVSELQCSLTAEGEQVSDPMHVKYQKNASDLHTVHVQLTSKSFISGRIPKGTSAIVDIAVSTPSGFKTAGAGAVRQWMDDAHTFEKRSFRKLLGDALWAKLELKNDAH